VQAAVPILEWAEIDLPGDNDLTIVSPSEVTGIAAGDNGLIYAVDAANGRLYRSQNYSLDWQEMTKYLDQSGATLPATLIAVAPDNEGIVAALTDGGNRLFVTLDGGFKWEDVNLPALAAGEEVTSIAISGVYSDGGDEYREIAVGTASWGDDLSNGEVYVLQGGCAWSYWQKQKLTVDMTDPAHIGADVAALAYSPAYGHDHTLVVVCATGADGTLDAGLQNRTFLCLGERDVDDGGTDWAFLDPDYPLELLEAGDAVGVTYLRATLALPSDFSSEDEESRSLFLSLEREPDYNDDVYRIIEDELDPAIDGRMDVDGGSDIDIWSIAYRGDLDDGTLLAGEREPVSPGDLNTQVWRCVDPWAASPDWEAASVPPTGPGHAYVVWAPDVSLAYCGTSSMPGVALDESAFSASTYGDLWRQMALIDTEFTLTDLLVTPDGKDLFLTTSNPWGPESVWQSFTDPLGKRWERVLTIDSDTEAVMIAMSVQFGKDRTLYVAVQNGDRIAVSHDAGSPWKWQRKSPEPLLDIVVVDENTLYAAIPGGEVMKSTNHARSWSDEPMDTGLDEINMLSMAADGTLFAGSTDGYVSYSTDGGASWTLIDEPLGDGAVQVLADVAFEQNGWFYAATDGDDEGLWRWKLGVYDDWEPMDDDITRLGGGQAIGGLLLGPEGTLYALRIEPASDDTGGMTRWLCPTCAPCADLEYDHVIEDLPDGVEFEAAGVFTTAHPAGTLWGNDKENDVFAIDSQGQRIFVFRDTLCKRGPKLESPEDRAHLDVNECNCNRDAVVAFDWENLDEVDEYQITYYHDASVSWPLWTLTSDEEDIVISPSGDTTEFLSGQRYGWRVRAIEPFLSPWSVQRSFTPTLCPVEGLVPNIGATGVSLTPAFTWDCQATVDGFEFVLAKDPEYASVVASFGGESLLTNTSWVCSTQLAAGSNYFWRVRSVRGDAVGSWVEGSFTTGSVATAPVTPANETIDIPAQDSGVSDWFIWAIFALAAIFMLGLIVLIMRTARDRY